MKKNLLLLITFALTVSVNAQTPKTIDFETIGTDSSWYVFSNVIDNPNYCAVVDNPDNSGLNTSAKVGKLVVLAAANPWAGIWSITAIKPFKWDSKNSLITILVYKNVISNFDLKFEALDNTKWAHEVQVPNTKTNEWELLTFDFSQYAGDTTTISRIVIIPDFPTTRTDGSVNYFDNIDFGAGPNSIANSKISKFKIYPNPVSNLLYVSGKKGSLVNIYDLTGALVISKITNSAFFKIDVSKLAPGIYFVNAENQTEKFIVK